MRLSILTFVALVLSAVPLKAEEALRIVSLGGAVTESVHALGAEAALVGIDSTSLYPADERDLPDVGYVRQLAAEGILSLRPRLILAGPEAGPPATLDQLKASGVRTVLLPSGYDLSAVTKRIRLIGQAIGREARGEKLAAHVERDMQALETKISTLTSRPRVLFLLQAGRGAPMVSGKGTAIDAMIGLAGGSNAVAGFHGYKPLTPEALAGLDPDYILVTTDTSAALGGKAGLVDMAGISLMPAAREGRVIEMDALLLSGFGPRLPLATRELAEALHPDAPVTW